ncbi:MULTISPECIES: DUF418 domain-containing protein [Paenibacillus]|uniref:DUF418 domain-containing protein n=1 Tax=Paenibacillus xylanilyticus TaxID=248903 RepID=A0A7Y6EY13_9BACL|nr:DUF418 domain-containing protein [Paenibacillus xylanilyticus]NUU78413.1 DUF418 domain-containing protein [Paenibacillus xylanilyticus]
MKRIVLLDVLRGFAIIGTLGTNIWLFAYLGNLNKMFGDPLQPWWATGDRILQTLMLLLVNGKFLGLLTLLFGAGMELKRQKALRKGYTWPGIYIWTCVLLFIDGLLHYTLVMEYDVLMSYAITGIMVSFIIHRSRRFILIIMGIMGSIHFIGVGGITALLALSESGSSFNGMEIITQLYAAGTWWEQVLFRLSNFVFFRTESIAIIPLNIFLFLFGALLMRAGVFSDHPSARRKRRKLMNIGLAAGIPLNLLLLIPGGMMDLFVRYISAPVLTLGYLGLIAYLLEKNTLPRLFERLGEIGKMALSCYILQNILASVLFYGWGLGLGGHPSSLLVLSMWAGICILMMLFSHVWLRQFSLGPVEWLWRKLSISPAAKHPSRSEPM